MKYTISINNHEYCYKIFDTEKEAARTAIEALGEDWDYDDILDSYGICILSLILIMSMYIASFLIAGHVIYWIVSVVTFNMIMISICIFILLYTFFGIYFELKRREENK